MKSTYLKERKLNEMNIQNEGENKIIEVLELFSQTFA